jgi:DNA replication protein DnaC
LGYLVFLELLLEDESQRQAQKALAGRLHRAHFETSRTLTDFDFAYSPLVQLQSAGTFTPELRL